jgi:hypothetical protein
MNHTHRTRRVSVTVAALAAAALALPACQGTATAASHRPHHHATHAAAQPTQNGLTATDLKDLANMTRGLPVVAGQPRVGKAWEHRRKFGGAGPAVGC